MGAEARPAPGQKIDLSPRTPNVPALHALPRSSSKPPKEIDEKAEEWKRERDRKR